MSQRPRSATRPLLHRRRYWRGRSFHSTDGGVEDQDKWHEGCASGEEESERAYPGTEEAHACDFLLSVSRPCSWRRSVATATGQPKRFRKGASAPHRPTSGPRPSRSSSVTPTRCMSGSASCRPRNASVSERRCTVRCGETRRTPCTSADQTRPVSGQAGGIIDTTGKTSRIRSRSRSVRAPGHRTRAAPLLGGRPACSVLPDRPSAYFRNVVKPCSSSVRTRPRASNPKLTFVQPNPAERQWPRKVSKCQCSSSAT